MSFKCFIAVLLIAYLIKHACFYQLILNILNDSLKKCFWSKIMDNIHDHSYKRR